MIVKMKKLSFIGMNSEKEMIIDDLQKLSAVQITPLTGSGRLLFLRNDGDEVTVRDYDDALLKIQSVINILSVFDTIKKSVFNQKREAGGNIHKKGTYALACHIIKLKEEQNRLKSEINKFTARAVFLEPWEKFDVPLEINGTKRTSLLKGTVPKDTVLPENGICFAETVFEDDSQKYVAVIYHNDDESQVSEYLKEISFTKTNFGDFVSTARENRTRLSEEILTAETKIDEITGKLKNYAASISDFENLYDHWVIKKEKKEVLSNFLVSNDTFVTEGYVPVETAVELQKSLTEKYTCYISFSDPGDGDDVPVLLKNNSFVRPFEFITETYNLPRYNNIDPNAAMSFFFAFFFGLMLSDGGYGLVMTIGATGVLWLKKPKGPVSEIVKLILWCGIATVFWGFMFGSWFGDILKPIGVNKIWIDPAEEPMTLLIWSVIFGFVHILTGMFVKAYILIRDGKPWDALFDAGFWILLLLAAPVWFLLPAYSEIGKYTAAACLIGILLTNGRDAKNILGKITGGLASVYNNGIGYAVDLLSYSRLLALGLATGVIATVINSMCRMMTGVWWGWIGFVIAFAGGHIFNFFINMLGAYVHSSRLQYVEFFGKFYDTGGKAFRPFRKNTKYINV